MVEDLPDGDLIGEEGDHLHLLATASADERVCRVDLGDEPGPGGRAASAGRLGAGLLRLGLVAQTSAPDTELDRAHGLRMMLLRRDWHGFDPIHIRPSLWRAAWTRILGLPPAADEPPRRRTLEGLRLYAMPPERQWLFGRLRETRQGGRRLRAGGRVWLY